MIYTANPLQAFSGQLIGGAFLVGLGLIAGVSVFVQRNISKLQRAATGCLGIILLLFGVALLVVTFFMYTAGAETLNARLARKRIVQQSDSNNTSTINVYRLEFGATTQFDVPQEAYDKMTQGTCYQVTYYPQKGLLQILGQTAPTPSSGGAVAAIKEYPPSQCR